MTERFNFYDIYGYVLPGFAVLALFALPFMLAQHRWVAAQPGVGTAPGSPAVQVSPASSPAQEPKDESSKDAWSFTSALAVTVLAYLVGHIVQILSRLAFRLPPLHSSLLEDGTFSPQFTGTLKGKIKEAFGIDADSAKPLADAFLLCRARLMQEKAGAYVEQFQGLEALMRGLTGALILGSGFQIGWALGRTVWRPTGALVLVLLLGLLGYDVLYNTRLARARKKGSAGLAEEHAKKLARGNRIWLWAFALAAVFVGEQASAVTPRTVSLSWLLMAAAGGALMIARRSYFAYVEQRRNFATTVYRDFVALKPSGKDKDKDGGHAARLSE